MLCVQDSEISPTHCLPLPLFISSPEIVAWVIEAKVEGPFFFPTAELMVLVQYVPRGV